MRANWKVLSLPFLLVLALGACGEGTSSSQQTSSGQATTSQTSGGGTSSSSAPTEGIALFDANSVLVGGVKANAENPNVPLPELKENILTAPLATYHLAGKGEAPYVEVSEMANAINVAAATVITPGITTESKSDGFHIYSPDKKGELILNAETDQVKAKNTASFSHPAVTDNNGVTGDYCIFRGKTIAESDKTKVYTEDGSAIPEYLTFDFAKYGFDIYKQNGKFYAPLEALSKVMYRDIGLDFAYNGKEFHLNALTNYTRARIYSSKGYWISAGAVYKPSAKKGEGEAFRFEYSYKALKAGSETETETLTKFMILNDDAAKTGFCVTCVGTEYDPNKTVPSDEAYFGYSWTREAEMLYVRVSQEGTPVGDYCIHLDETNYNKKVIDKGVSEYNYNILRFLFDNIYGLKAIKGITDAEAYFESVGAKEGLKSTQIADYNKALAKLIGAVDDGHTSLTSLSPYTAYEDSSSLGELMSEEIGPRLKDLGTKKKKYAQARVTKYAELSPTDPQSGNTDPNYYQGLTLSKDKKTAIITFDGFQHSAAEIDSMGTMFPPDYEIGESEYRILSRYKMVNSSPDGFSAAFQILKTINKNADVVKNVVVDLTNNGGGMIATLPYLAAFFTDDPTYVLKDTTNNTVREYHYKVDLNADGVYGGAGDTFKGKFNFFFLTSGFSFSCGNCLPGMAKDAGVKIIGERSGGGVSPVGVYLDALGSGINLSNFTNMCYKGSDGKYMQNDAGIPLDHEFPLQNGNWYDPEAINTFVSSL